MKAKKYTGGKAGSRTAEFRIKELLAQRRDPVSGHRFTMASLARLLDLPYPTVCGVVYGTRRNEGVRQRIADFLGVPVPELFGEPPEAPQHLLAAAMARVRRFWSGNGARGAKVEHD